MTSKASLRRQFRAERRALSPAEHARRSHLATSAITQLPAFKAGSRIAFYMPFDHEVDTDALVSAARRRGIRIFVPIVTDFRHRRIRFFPLSGAMRRGAFGILVPRAVGKPTAPRWFNLIVVPIVGVDDAGRRLGMGGGFYDRAFGFRRLRRIWRGPKLVGLAFDCQRADSVLADPWDLRLDSLATESGLRHFTKGSQ